MEGNLEIGLLGQKFPKFSILWNRIFSNIYKIISKITRNMRFENFPPDRYLRGNERIDLYPIFICKKGRERKEGELELRSVLSYAERLIFGRENIPWVETIAAEGAVFESLVHGVNGTRGTSIPPSLLNKRERRS